MLGLLRGITTVLTELKGGWQAYFHNSGATILLVGLHTTLKTQGHPQAWRGDMGKKAYSGASGSQREGADWG